MIEWLPEEVNIDGSGRPVRPDLPWLRNLSWTKLHAMQIGVALGIIIYWGQLLNYGGVVFGLVIAFIQIILGHRQKKSSRTGCTHSVGFHDVKHKPWYTTYSTLPTWALLTLVFGLP